LWSKPESWEGEGLLGHVPLEDEEVNIPAGYIFAYDVTPENSVKLKHLEINGDLFFMDGEDRLLQSYGIWVRAGNLTIGNETHPFESKATITLLGDNTDEYWAFTNSIEAGNKNLVVTSFAQMYG
jgi:hypothetical protein